MKVKEGAAGKLRLSKKEKLLLTALAFLQFTHTVDFMILMPLGPVLIAQFGIGNQEFSYLVSSYTFSAGISALFASTFIDRFNRKKVLLFIFTGFIFSTLLCGISNSYEMLLFSRIITGAFGGLINSMVYSIIGDSFAYEHRGQATGVVMGSFSAASVVGIPLSLLLANKFGWNIPFIALFGIGFIFLFFAIYAIPIAERVSREHPYWTIFTTARHYPAFLLTISMMLAGFSMIPFISNFLVFNTAMTEDDLPKMYLLGGIATYVSSNLFGYLSDKYGKKRMFYIMALFSMISIFSFTKIDEKFSIAAILVITTVFFIFITGRWVPAMALVTSVAKPQLRGSYMTFNTAIQQLGSGLATYIGGRLIVQQPNHELGGFNLVAYFSMAVTVVTVVCVYFMKVFDDKHRELS